MDLETSRLQNVNMPAYYHTSAFREVRATTDPLQMAIYNLPIARFCSFDSFTHDFTLQVIFIVNRLDSHMCTQLNRFTSLVRNIWRISGVYRL